jgi:hypothetical protein
MLQSKENGFGPTREVVTADLSKASRKAMVSFAVKHYKADRIAYKATRGTQSAARLASKRPGPVVQRLDLVRQMNEGLV